jgi:hypothetical protein
VGPPTESSWRVQGRRHRRKPVDFQRVSGNRRENLRSKLLSKERSSPTLGRLMETSSGLTGSTGNSDPPWRR